MSVSHCDLLIRPFEAKDQEVARTLILEGLGEHFGNIDESLNPDLDDITASYIAQGHAFVVAQIDENLVGTGALIREDENIGRIARMSVRKQHRRRGVGRALTKHLIKMARGRGFKRLLVETNNDWDDAIGLYKHCGFIEYDLDDVSVHMGLDLKESKFNYRTVG